MMNVLGQKEIYQIIKATQNRRNQNAEGDRKREEAKNKYLRYFSPLMKLVMLNNETSEKKDED